MILTSISLSWFNNKEALAKTGTGTSAWPATGDNIIDVVRTGRGEIDSVAKVQEGIYRSPGKQSLPSSRLLEILWGLDCCIERREARATFEI